MNIEHSIKTHLNRSVFFVLFCSIVFAVVEQKSTVTLLIYAGSIIFIIVSIRCTFNRVWSSINVKYKLIFALNVIFVCLPFVIIAPASVIVLGKHHEYLFFLALFVGFLSIVAVSVTYYLSDK